MKPTDVTGQWCIHYRKMTEPKVWHTMKLCRADGVLVSAKTFDEVFKFSRYREAFDFAKNLITDGPDPKYDAIPKRVCRKGKKSFYLSGN
jgi:hypothetical protein